MVSKDFEEYFSKSGIEDFRKQINWGLWVAAIQWVKDIIVDKKTLPKRDDLWKQFRHEHLKEFGFLPNHTQKCAIDNFYKYT